MFQEFKTFIARGNVLDLAVGVIIGAAFGKIVTSLTESVIMPVVAWLIGQYGFGITGTELFAIVVLAGLPTAQNVFNYAQRYERGVIVARDTILITTVGSLPVLMVVAAVLH